MEGVKNLEKQRPRTLRRIGIGMSGKRIEEMERPYPAPGHREARRPISLKR